MMMIFTGARDRERGKFKKARIEEERETKGERRERREGETSNSSYAAVY